MKAKIVKEYGNTNWLKVYAEDKVINCFLFRDNVLNTESDSYESIFKKAMELVSRIEKCEKFPLEETIYETKTD